MQKALRYKRRFLKNPHWKEYYKKAPSDACREYIANEFCFSLFGEDDDRTKQDAELEGLFTVEDWKHLGKYAGNNPFRGKCREMIKKLDGAS